MEQNPKTPKPQNPMSSEIYFWLNWLSWLIKREVNQVYFNDYFKVKNELSYNRLRGLSDAE